MVVGKYFMYSPLTLFADACSADASDAYEFNKAVNI
jgi:hexosaminidase